MNYWKWLIKRNHGPNKKELSTEIERGIKFPQDENQHGMRQKVLVILREQYVQFGASINKIDEVINENLQTKENVRVSGRKLKATWLKIYKKHTKQI